MLRKRRANQARCVYRYISTYVRTYVRCEFSHLMGIMPRVCTHARAYVRSAKLSRAALRRDSLVSRRNPPVQKRAKPFARISCKPRVRRSALQIVRPAVSRLAVSTHPPPSPPPSLIPVDSLFNRAALFLTHSAIHRALRSSRSKIRRDACCD